MNKTQNHPHGDILIVDDNLSNLKTLTDILTVTGYTVRSATGGESALRSVEDKQPDLILLDYKMGGMNGIEVCRSLKENPKLQDIPVIFLSAHGDTALRIEAIEAGGIDYVIKPVNPLEILAKIDNHLKLFRLQKKLELQSENLTRQIEERKRVEKKNVYLSKLLDGSLNEIFIFDSETLCFLDVNQGARTNLGYSLAELRGMTPLDLKPEVTAEKFAQLISPLRSGAKEKVILTTVHKRKDGTLYPVEIHLQLMHAEQPVFVAIILDITERRKMEEQLFLNEKLTTIAGLAAGAAHEINTPLSAIIQAHQLVEMGLSPENANSAEKAGKYNVDLTRVQEYLKDNELDYFMAGIRESALKAGKIIKSLLEFSRPHKGSFSSVNLKEIIESALLLSRADYDMKKKYHINNIHIVTEYAPDLSPVTCVGTEIEQVVLHLIKNSAQSMTEADLQEEPCIFLRIATGKNKAVIEVEDNGPGMSEDVKKHIFDPFFTTREVGTGTGLGLSVAHSIIVDKHKGKIGVQSEPDKGAKFIIELPLLQAG